MQPQADFDPQARRQEAAARRPFGRAGDADAGSRRSLLLAGQCRDRGRRRAAAADLEARAAHQEHPRRSARLADARRAQGRRSAGRRARDADGPAAATDDPARARRYLRRQPEAEMFAGFADFAFYRIATQRARIWSPASAASSISSRTDVLTDLAERGRAARGRGRRHRAHERRSRRGLPALCDQAAAARPDGDWRCVGFDPEGLELQHGRMALRLPFPQR